MCSVVASFVATTWPITFMMTGAFVALAMAIASVSVFRLCAS